MHTFLLYKAKAYGGLTADVSCALLQMISADLHVAKGPKADSEEIKQHFQWKIRKEDKELEPVGAESENPFQIRFGDIRQDAEVRELLEKEAQRVKRQREELQK